MRTTTSPAATVTRPALRLSLPRRPLLLFCATGIVLAAIAQLIGAHILALGVGSVTFYPLIWGILLGGAVSLQRVRPVPLTLQKAAPHLVEAGVFLLAARLSLTVGPNLGVLLHAGPAMLLQEVGHLLGTVLFSLPVAVLLRMGRPAVGACFSIDRESSFAMVSEKYGADSDEYRGVLGMYVFGTVFGALYVGLLASVLSSLHVFNPLALAMGSGVGSGSVMAAASASIAAAHPELGSQVLAVATVSNLITSILGGFVGMFIALPLADRFYRLLTRRRSARGAALPAPTAIPAEPVDETPQAAPARWITLPVMAFAMMLSNILFHRGIDLTEVLGFAAMIAVVVVALAVKKLTRLPAIVGVAVLATALTTPISPVADLLTRLVAPIDFLSLTVPVLVFAGLGIGKDMPVLRRVGWRIVPVGLVSFAATFVAAAAIAQFALHM
ncbi:DUF3100 domain-containing protein [Rhodococcus olei]